MMTILILVSSGSSCPSLGRLATEPVVDLLGRHWRHCLGTLLALRRLSGIAIWPLLRRIRKPHPLSAADLGDLLVLTFLCLCFGRPVGSFYSALIAFVLFEAAYYSEIMRAGIQSVARVRSSAGQSTG